MPEGIEINEIHKAYDLSFQRMKVNLTKQYGPLPESLPTEFRRNK
jgi:hypothetical protein